MILFNLLTVPKLLKKARERIKELQDPKVNESYSRISKYIYRLVQFQEITMSVCIFQFVAFIIWIEIEFVDLEINEIAKIDKVLWVYMCFAGMINFIIFTNDSLLILQALEWSIMIYFMKYQDEKTLSSIIQHMSNADTRRKFIRGEGIIIYSHLIAMILILVLTYVSMTIISQLEFAIN